MANTRQRRTTPPWWVIGLLLFGGSVLACTLAPSSAPPTLSPRTTATPPPTIGYATLAPDELPAEASPAPTSVAFANPTISLMMNQVEVDRLMSHVNALAGFYTRHVNSAQDRDDRGIGAAKRYIDAQFRQVAAQTQGKMAVFGQDFLVDWAGVRTTQTNIIAILPGTTAGAGTIVVGAHYDSRGDDDTDATGYAPGANDNGTGVAALIEMARIMSQHEHRATVVFVAFSAEEIGRKGSIAFVNDYVRANNIDLRVYINVDAIGSQVAADGSVSDRQLRVFSDGPNDTSTSRQVARFAEMIALNYVPEMEIAVQDALDRPGRYGDHFSFQEVGYPAVRFIEMAENYSYADTSDTVDGITPGYFRRSTQTILAVLATMADGLQPPMNIALRNNGNGTQTLVWTEVPGATGYVVGLRSPGAMIYQQFETAQTSVTWDGFNRYTALAVAAKDANGVMGQLSPEIAVAGGFTLTGVDRDQR